MPRQAFHLMSSELLMNEHAKRIRKPRCFLLYALAPSDLPAAEANRILNAFIGDPHLPLAIFLIFAHSPSALDAQIAFTLRAYRGANSETLRKENRPAYGDPSREAETAEEEE